MVKKTQTLDVKAIARLMTVAAGALETVSSHYEEAGQEGKSIKYYNQAVHLENTADRLAEYGDRSAAKRTRQEAKLAKAKATVAELEKLL